jgi:hypothetical protein
MTYCLLNHYITGHLMFHLVSIGSFILFSAISNPASCDIRAFISYLHFINISAAEIHHEFCALGLRLKYIQ